MQDTTLPIIPIIPAARPNCSKAEEDMNAWKAKENGNGVHRSQNGAQEGTYTSPKQCVVLIRDSDESRVSRISVPFGIAQPIFETVRPKARFSRIYLYLCTGGSIRSPSMAEFPSDDNLCLRTKVYSDSYKTALRSDNSRLVSYPTCRKVC